jgi:hypothetical protein
LSSGDSTPAARQSNFSLQCLQNMQYQGKWQAILIEDKLKHPHCLIVRDKRKPSGQPLQGMPWSSLLGLKNNDLGPPGVVVAEENNQTQLFEDDNLSADLFGIRRSDIPRSSVVQTYVYAFAHPSEWGPSPGGHAHYTDNDHSASESQSDSFPLSISTLSQAELTGRAAARIQVEAQMMKRELQEREEVLAGKEVRIALREAELAGSANAIKQKQGEVRQRMESLKSKENEIAKKQVEIQRMEREMQEREGLLAQKEVNIALRKVELTERADNRKECYKEWSLSSLKRTEM